MDGVNGGEDVGARLAPSRAAVSHWLGQRLSAALLLVLVPWLMFSLGSAGGMELDDLRQWIGRPSHALGLALFFLAAWYHAALGLEVVVQDYVRPESLSAVLVLGVRLAAVVGAVAAVGAVIWIVAGMQ